MKSPIETDEWEGLLDPRSGECYFRNKESKEMTWKTPIPLELSAKRGKRSKRSADADWVTVKNLGDDAESYEYNASLAKRGS